jgi:hypothetical protein
VTADDVEAHYDKGMLEVRRVAKPVAAPKKVAIKAAEAQRSIEAEQKKS